MGSPLTQRRGRTGDRRHTGLGWRHLDPMRAAITVPESVDLNNRRVNQSRVPESQDPSISKQHFMYMTAAGHGRQGATFHDSTKRAQVMADKAQPSTTRPRGLRDESSKRAIQDGCKRASRGLQLNHPKGVRSAAAPPTSEATPTRQPAHKARPRSTNYNIAINIGDLQHASGPPPAVSRSPLPTQPPFPPPPRIPHILLPSGPSIFRCRLRSKAFWAGRGAGLEGWHQLDPDLPRPAHGRGQAYLSVLRLNQALSGNAGLHQTKWITTFPHAGAGIQRHYSNPHPRPALQPADPSHHLHLIFCLILSV